MYLLYLNKQDQPGTGLTADELYEGKTKSQTALFIHFYWPLL